MARAKTPAPRARNAAKPAPDYLKKILTARVYDVAIESPLDAARSLSRRIGNTVWLKREDQQPVFSFKLRGAYNKMAHLSAEALAKGVICASAGNHAQGVALSARKLGCRAVIVMPVTTPRLKIDAVGALGGEVLLHGDSYSDAYAHALAVQQAQGLTFVHPFDDPDVIAGQGTIAMEILRQHGKPIHAIFCCVGGGGLLAGVAAYVKRVRPDIKVIGDECWQCKLCYIKCPYTPDEEAKEQLDFPRLMARERAVRARRDPAGARLVGRAELRGDVGRQCIDHHAKGIQRFAERQPPGLDAELLPQRHQRRGLGCIAGDDRQLPHTELRQRNHRRGRRATGPQHGRRARHLTQRADDPVDVGVVGPPPAVDAHQRVGRADQLGARRAFGGEPQCGELAGHGDRDTDPFRTETAYQVRQLGLGAFDAVVRPVGEPELTVGRQVQLRGPRVRDGRTQNRGSHRALSSTPLRFASSMLARCCW